MEEKLVGPAYALYMVRIEYYERKGGHRIILEWELEDTALFRHPLWIDEKAVTTQIIQLKGSLRKLI